MYIGKKHVIIDIFVYVVLKLANVTCSYIIFAMLISCVGI